MLGATAACAAFADGHDAPQCAQSPERQPAGSALPKSGLYFSPGKVSTGPNVPKSALR